jgi:nitrite reductase/ring-hydroxylating ferredoxin subunit
MGEIGGAVMTRTSVARIGDVPPGTMLGFDAPEERILVANVGGTFYAMRAKCNHMGGSLDKGSLEGAVVTCPLHGSKWDVTTGKLLQFTRPLPPEKVYQVTVENGQISVEV